MVLLVVIKDIKVFLVNLTIMAVECFSFAFNLVFSRFASIDKERSGTVYWMTKLRTL